MHRKQALQMLLTGEFIDAATAQQFGLVNTVVPAEELDAAASLAGAGADKPPPAVRLGKEMFYRRLDMGLEDACRFAAGCMARNLDSEDARAGIDAFLGKRKPPWTSR